MPLPKTPVMVVHHKGKFDAYQDASSLDLFVHFANRILYPVVILKSVEEVNRFSNTYNEWEENTPFYQNGYFELGQIFNAIEKTTRVIVFTSEKDEYKDELKIVNQAARALVYLSLIHI